MPSDRSRTSDDLRQQYKAVVAQQGRVILDRDLNALQEIAEGQLAGHAADEIGPCGTPDNGFAVSVPAASTAVAVSSYSYVKRNPWDFAIAGGTMYVGGQRANFSVNPGNWSYFRQPDWNYPPDPTGYGTSSYAPPGREYIYLRVFEQEVGAVEDPDLLDVALGGPDTTQRVRLMRRVERLPVSSNDYLSSLNQAQLTWNQQGFWLNKPTLRLLPQVTLQVSFETAPATPAPSLCDPVAQGGYLGAENQLIRVQIAAPAAAGQPYQLLWGYDNASFLYRASAVPGGDGKTLQLVQTPVDAYHIPTTGQTVEVLRASALLMGENDGPAPTGPPSVVRCVASATGQVALVAQYVNGANTLVLQAVLPQEYLGDPNLFVRVWQNQQPIVSFTKPVVLTDAAGQTPGVQVTVAPIVKNAANGALPVGAFWMFALRPGAAQGVYPARFLASPQQPDGPRQWICPLAVIDWQGDAPVFVPPHSAPIFSTPVHGAASASVFAPGSFSGPNPTGPKVYDFRVRFDNLATLSSRLSCCTLSVSPADVNDLQDKIDSAVTAGGPVAICFTPGTYVLPQPLVLTAAHSGLILEGCPGGVILRAADPTQFLGGLIVLIGANDVSLCKLQFALPQVALDAALATTLTGGSSLSSLMGVTLVQSRRLTLTDCEFDYGAPTGPALGVGIFCRGDCSGVTVTGSRFTASAAATATPPPAGAPATPSAAGTPALAFFGVLAMPTAVQTGNTVTRLLPSLHETILRDNRFINLSLAVLAVADMGSMQVYRNTVSACLGGFWLESFDANPPINAIGASALTWQQCYNAASGFTEIANSFSAGPAFPWPAPGLDAMLAAWAQNQGALIPLRLSLTDNQIDTVLQGQTAGAPGLTLFLNRPLGSDTAAYLVVSTNTVRTATLATNVPSVLLAIQGGLTPVGPVALTGNLIVNTTTVRVTPPHTGIVDEIRFFIGGFPSLLIFPGGGPQIVAGLAVTGNVLLGPTDLGDLNLPPPLTTWAQANAIHPPPPAPAPVITGLYPVSGAANTIVGIAGNGFTGVNQVTFGGVAALAVVFNSDRSISATAPPMSPTVIAAGPVEIIVWTSNGSSSPQTAGADTFKYSAAPSPMITGLSPTTGSPAGGYPVTITGSGFAGASGVAFGATAVAAGNFTVNSDGTLITVTKVPQGAAGQVDVTVTVSGVTSAKVPADRFWYLGAPVLTSLSPASVTTIALVVGAVSVGGVPVTITGSGLTGATVAFDGITVSSSPGSNPDTTLTVTAPVQSLGVGSKSVSVVVKTSGGTSSPAIFTYIVTRRFPIPVPKPIPPKGRPGSLENA